MAEVEAPPRPAAACVKIPADGAAPYLEGFRCTGCKAVFLEPKPACPACRARGTLQPQRLGDTGTLYNFTVVHRNFPGVPVPFVSAIVDLDGGGSIKGNLIDIPPSPEAIKFGMPVKVVFRDAGRLDKDGNAYLAYFFAPAN